MILPLGFGELDISNWARGLIAAVISGGAGAISGGLAVTLQDPGHYNLQNHLGNVMGIMGTAFVINGLIGAAMYLTKSPLPEFKTVTTREEKTVVGPPKTTTVTTREETHIEPKD
jgi:hypothetical protein